MSTISGAFQRCAKEERAALICYLTAGYPDYESSIGHMIAADNGGADILEIGVPFSDPVADGPVIQRTSQIALEKGMTPRGALALAATVRSRSKLPIVLMGYYNPIFRMGDEAFVHEASAAGVDGLIIADMPYEESEDIGRICKEHEVDLIQLAGPTTNERRMRAIAAASSGYLYLVSSLGTTGARGELPAELPDLIRRAKNASDALPVAVGFGVSRREHASQIVAAGADGVIVGSALLGMISAGGDQQRTTEFVRDLRQGCSRIGP
ncbi:MAG: tryptophan synthase subunit alpha [Methanomassiliicoccales archaeon]|nr:tryptophan synthase subunit alpha [Methanomassiliicoccales archaeon]